jgi:hypothetical protein
VPAKHAEKKEEKKQRREEEKRKASVKNSCVLGYPKSAGQKVL